MTPFKNKKVQLELAPTENILTYNDTIELLSLTEFIKGINISIMDEMYRPYIKTLKDILKYVSYDLNETQYNYLVKIYVDFFGEKALDN